MNYYEDIVSDDEFFREAKREQLSKEELLDQNFKKAQKSRGHKGPKIKKEVKKPFLKSGILLMITAIICLVIINFSPWAYVKCDDSTGDNEIEKIIYIRDDSEDIKHEEIVNIFKAPETKSSSLSSNFIGIDFKDFKNSSFILNIGFITLLMLGLAFIVVQTIDRSKNLFKNGFMLFHTVFSSIVILVCFFLLFSLIRFFSVHSLLNYNSNFITTNNVFILFPVPIAISIILLLVIKAAFSIIKMYLKKVRSNIERKNQKSNPLSVYGG